MITDKVLISYAAMHHVMNHVMHPLVPGGLSVGLGFRGVAVVSLPILAPVQVVRRMRMYLIDRRRTPYINIVCSSLQP